MSTFRLNDFADAAKAQWDLKQRYEGGDKKP